jgi:hypothetical protein
LIDEKFGDLVDLVIDVVSAIHIIFYHCRLHKRRN